jgi:hypothetical protein
VHVQRPLVPKCGDRRISAAMFRQSRRRLAVAVPLPRLEHGEHSGDEHVLLLDDASRLLARLWHCKKNRSVLLSKP